MTDRSPLLDPERSRVLLVGAGRYGPAAQLDDLPSVPRGIVALERLLIDPRRTGLNRGSCVTVLDPSTPEKVDAPLWRLVDEAEDTLMVYYSGHGVPHPTDGTLHLGVASTDRRRLHSTAVPIDWIRSALRESQARAKVVVLDCCFSGRAVQPLSAGALAAEIDVEGTFVMTASAANTLAVAPVGERYTAFTGAFIGTLDDGVAEAGELLDLETIFRGIRGRLRQRGYPEPQVQRLNEASRLALARNVAWMGAAAHPSDAETEARGTGDFRLVFEQNGPAVDDAVPWRLTITNIGTTRLTEVVVRRADGEILAEAVELKPGRQQVVRWAACPDARGVEHVMVTALDPTGSQVMEHLERRPAPAPVWSGPRVPVPTIPPASTPEDDDSEGARLVALNMVLNGVSRADVDRYIAENFEVSGRDALLDGVFGVMTPVPATPPPQGASRPPRSDVTSWRAAPKMSGNTIRIGETKEDAEGARLVALNMALHGEPRAVTDAYLKANFILRDRVSLLDEVYASVEAAEPAAGKADDDSEGARLVALNMALNGAPREAIDRYLAAHFTLQDRQSLLAEVYDTIR
ncbi:caspase, EACC1-associated type [Baekduia sp. Peel2402]|uniref:caspase, EACC1-associated type n=1 Tax=Baekduia sp. Peel2402 TaxID=3458296 RepID=UPI00403E7F9D